MPEVEARCPFGPAFFAGQLAFHTNPSFVSRFAARGKGARVGFDPSREPMAMGGITMTPEQALQAASGDP